MKQERLGIKHLANNIVLIYAFFSSIWIVYSDRLLAVFTSNPQQLTQLQTLKGWVFILITSGLLYVLVRRGWKSLHTSNTLLQAVIEGTTDAVFIKDCAGRYLLINSAGAQVLGKPQPQIIGQDDTQFLPPEIANQLMQTDQRILTTGQSEMVEETVIVNGIKRTYLSTKSIYHDVHHRVVGLIGIARDITERKQLLEQLQREKEDLVALSAVTANGISTLNLDELLNVLLRRIVEVMRADAAIILLKQDNLLKARASIGIEQAVYADYVIPIGEGFAGTIGVTMQPMYVEDAQTNPLVINPFIKQNGIRSMLGIPLVRHGNLVGILHLDWLNIHPMSDRELHILEITAERCTMAILNAQLYEQSKQLQERLQLQIDCMPVGCIVNDAQLCVTDWNPAAEKIFGYTKAEVLGKDACDLITSPSVCQQVRRIFRQLEAGEKTVYSINENKTKDGRTLICEWYNTPLKKADGTVIGMLSMVQDITERKRAEQELRKKDVLYRTLARNFPNGAVFLFDRNLRYTLAEGAAITAQGIKSEWFEGKTIWEALPEQMCERLEPSYRQALAGTPTSFETPYDDRVFLVQVLPVTNSSGEIYAGMAVTQDITERKQTEAQLWHYAYYDLLTDLPNRALFLERLEQQMAEVRSEGGLFAVLLLELERFDMVKYSLGHQEADQLLVAMAHRLETCLQPNETLARLRSSEFAMLLVNLQDSNEATARAEHIHQLLMLPFDLNGREVFSTASIGIALYSQGSGVVGVTPTSSAQQWESRTPNSSKKILNPSLPGFNRAEDLLRAADTAKHHAKALTQDRCAVFNVAMQEQAVTRFQLETDLRRAIERQQLRVYYQPIVSIETGKIAGFEALVRWSHPTRGWVSPMEFIPLAEEMGLIGLIDRWVLREACTQLRRWQQEFPSQMPLTISVNVSGLQLGQLGLLERLDKILRETGIEGNCLKLEITESSLLHNTACGIAMLKQLKLLGIQLSIDDFGTGYSSLERLHQLPIDTLKIDRSFVNRLGDENDSLEIVRTIITLAHSLAMDVVAEGVETPPQLAQLRSLNCEYVQGYLFSRPVDEVKAGELLAAELQC